MNWLLWKLKHAFKKYPRIDPEFPSLINIETVSACNLRCIHCPSHRQGSPSPRKFGSMPLDAFLSIMDQIDGHGKRRIALHKDGEPLLHPQIISILERVKARVDHDVYLTTNGQVLTSEITQAILAGRIDHFNVSIGAHSPQTYRKIRGGDLERVKRNVQTFLEARSRSEWKPSVSVQIIDLEGMDLQREIADFRRYWSSMGVACEVWSELSWGIESQAAVSRWRYPCYSLWDSMVINSDLQVSACCIDWSQSLIVGDVSSRSIQEIWKGDALRRNRIASRANDFRGMELCRHCNYWQTLPMIHRSQHPEPATP
ncbi:MAG TPA: radical SAM protein [Fibrobacteria bacterium]|nr:radical SAM protein [Fibrobacteria bacterium]